MVRQLRDHRRIVVEHFRQNGEIVVVDDRIDPPPERREPFGNEPADPLDIFACARTLSRSKLMKNRLFSGHR